MVKIDLKALQNKDSKVEENIVENNSDETEIKVEEEKIPKKIARISLKDLKISSKENKKIETASSEKISVEKIDIPEIVEIKKEAPKISISSIKEEKKEILETIVESKVEEEPSNDKEENLVKTESLYIADGDTTCRINNEKPKEIFSNYKGSYSKEVIEEKKVEENEVKNEIIEEKKEDEIQETKKEEVGTNLEKFKKGNKKLALTKRKKIALGISLSLVVVFGSIFSIFNQNSVKTNVMEYKNELKNDMIPPPPEKHIKKPIIIERETENVNNNINGDIVKENELINFDNVEKNGNINKSVEDYLTKKFKK